MPFRTGHTRKVCPGHLKLIIKRMLTYFNPIVGMFSYSNEAACVDASSACASKVSCINNIRTLVVPLSGFCDGNTLHLNGETFCRTGHI